MYKKIRKPLLIATICALVAFLILSIWAALANQILLTTIAGIIESITLFALILQIVLLAEQNRLALESLLVDDSRKSKEKAIEMARFFEEEILYRSAFISLIYKESKIAEIIRKIYRTHMNDFDIEEMKSLFTQADITTLQSNICDNLDKNISFFLNEKHPLLSHPLASETLSKLQDDTLNKLESFCMYFKYGLADEEIVYQSLHQVFLDTISLLYYSISSRNTDPCEKYYTNIINIFVNWRNRNEERKALLEKKRQEIKNDLPYRGKDHSVS